MPPHRKFIRSSVADTFQKIIWARNRFTEQEGQNSANKCQMNTDDFSAIFGEFYFPLYEVSTE